MATPEDSAVRLWIDGQEGTVGLPVDTDLSLGTHVLEIRYGVGANVSETRVTITRDADLDFEDFASPDEMGSRFGAKMAATGDLLVVGAPFADVGGVTDAGAAYVFRRTDGAWGVPTQITALTPQAGARFGDAVATDGSVVAIGALLEDVMHDGSLVMNAGAAYAFRASGPATWDDIVRFTIATDSSEIPVENDQFGVSVSTSQRVLAVGSFTRDTTGVVFMYEFDGFVWSAPQIVRPEGVATAARFGETVFTSSGAYLFVGAPSESTSAGGIDPAVDEGASASGAVFVFERETDAEPWVQSAMLKAETPQAFDRFGASFIFDNQVLVVGAPGEDGGQAGGGHTDDDDDGSLDSGAVYRFRVSSFWRYQGYLKAEVNVAGARFGSSVANLGNLLAVGASQADEQRGATSLVAFTARGWVFSAALEPTGAPGDLFGGSAIMGRHGVVIGYPQSDTGTGGIRFFE